MTIMTAGRYELVRKASPTFNSLAVRSGRRTSYRYAGETPEVYNILRDGEVWYVVEQYVSSAVYFTNQINGYKFTECGDIENASVELIGQALMRDKIGAEA